MLTPPRPRARSTHPRLIAPLTAVLAVTLLIVAVGYLSGRLATAAAGDFQLDFVAAENTTYYQHGPSEGSEIGPAEPVDLAFDDRTINDDVVEQLEAEDFICGDRIVFFTEVAVDPEGDDDQTVFLEYDFDAENGGQVGVGYSEVLNAGISGVTPPFNTQQSGEDGNVSLDGTETAILVDELYEPVGAIFGDPDPDLRAEHLIAVVKVTGLDAGEVAVVRIDVRFSCYALPVTGNLHAALRAAALDGGDGVYGGEVSDDDTINVGQQDIPMLGLGELPTPTPSPIPSPTPSPTPTPTPTLEPFTPTPSPTASPTPSPTPTPTPTPSPTPSPTLVPTASPTPTVAAQVVGPEALPVTGGSPGSGSSGAALALLVLGGGAVLTGGTWYLVVARRRIR